MITANMREYSYYRYLEDNEYGQRALLKDNNGEPVVQGTVKLSITNTTTSIRDSIKYKDAQYLGLTLDKFIDDSYAIQYGEELLKVLYVIPQGRYKQVFLTNI